MIVAPLGTSVVPCPVGFDSPATTKSTMWNRSYRWQRQVRLTAAAIVIVSMCAGMVVLRGTAPARRVQLGASDMIDELRSSKIQNVDVVVPADLQTRIGNLVYRDRADGVPQVIGRVIAAEPAEKNQITLRIRLSAQSEDDAQLSGVLRGAPSSLNLRDAITLLISPNTPEQELLVARDVIWPSIRARLLPQLMDGLAREISNEMASLDEQDQALLTRSIEQLRTRLRPLEEDLVDRLARRAWDTVGVTGLASGIWNVTTDEMQNRGATASDWWLKMLGKSSKSDKPPSRPFLSDETALALQAALEEEAIAFWSENQDEILATLKSVVLEMRPEFEAAFKERWARRLYERAVRPAWQDSQDVVLEAVQEYVNDFAARKLLTKAGGPRLLFAFALRSTLDISTEPLLVFTPATDAKAQGIRYEPLLP